VGLMPPLLGCSPWVPHGETFHRVKKKGRRAPKEGDLARKRQTFLSKVKHRGTVTKLSEREPKSDRKPRDQEGSPPRGQWGRKLIL